MFRSRSAVYVTAFAAVAVYFLIWPIWRANFALEIWWTEGWNAYYQDAVSYGGTLYPPPNSLITNNYPPLSFYVTGWLSKLFGDSLYVGRAMSIVALLVIAMEITLAVVLLGGAPLYGAVGGLWFVAIMAHNSATFVGADDPQIVGLAIMGAGLVWFLARERAGRSCLLPLLLMVLAGFWKHNIVAIPVTAVIWLAYTRGPRSIGTIALSVAVAALGLAACGLLFGADFFANLLAPRAHSLWLIPYHLGHLQWLAIAYLIWAIWSFSARHTAAAKFTLLHVNISFVACILQWIGDGVAQNAEFDVMISLGIGIGLTLSGVQSLRFARVWGPQRTRDAIVIVLLLRLVLSSRQESAWVLFSPAFRAAFYAAEEVVAREVARAAAIPGPLFCSNKIICRLAGKPFTVDEFKLEQMVATGAATPTQITQLLESRGITTFVADQSTYEAYVTRTANPW